MAAHIEEATQKLSIAESKNTYEKKKKKKERHDMRH